MFSQRQLTDIEIVLKSALVDKGVDCVLLIDMAGNMIANINNGKSEPDVYSLAALAAGNYGAVNALAGLLGEEDFSLQFHKGKLMNIHFKSIPNGYLVISLFQNDLSLGYLRLLVSEVSKEIQFILTPKVSNG
jgi:hypothetical protein